MLVALIESVSVEKVLEPITAAQHKEKAGEFDVGDVEVPVVGEIVEIEIEGVAGRCPMEFRVEAGMGAIGREGRGGLVCRKVEDFVVAVAVLETERPRGGETRNDSVVEGGDELMAEVFEGILRFVNRLVAIRILRHPSVVEAKTLEGLVRPEEVVAIDVGCEAETIVIE